MGNKRKILIIEDDDSNRRILEMAIEKVGCEVFSAQNGEDGLTVAERIRPNLILMDVMMPKMGGIETLENIRKSSTLKKIPVLVISAKAAKTDAEAAMQAGANEFITKPFRVKEVLEIVLKYLGEK